MTDTAHAHGTVRTRGIARSATLADRPLPRLSDLRFAGVRPTIAPEMFSGLVRIAEVATASATGFLIASVYVAQADFAKDWQYLTTPLLTGLTMLGIYQWLGLYSVAAYSSLASQLVRLCLGWTASIVTLVAGIFFLKAGDEFSRVWLALWYVLGFATIIALRLYIQAISRRAIAEGRLARRAVIYGGGEPCRRLLDALEADDTSDLRICGIFDERFDDRREVEVAGYPVLGDTEALVDFCRRNRVDMVIVALPLAAEARVARLKEYFRVLPADIRMAANASELRLSPHAYSYVGEVPMIDLSDRPISTWGTIAKSIFDKTIASMALLALAPLMAVVALAVKLESKGPVFFRQKRYGFNNELIEVLKFRSMYTEMTDANASRLVTRDDPRVTRVGRLIRKTSLDELPQLFNVLGGTLSLVGPRPHAVQAKAADKLYPDVVDGYFARHKVKPGITGWAQIHGWRGETDTPEKIQKRVEHDLYYIDNWSLLLDVYILAKTPASLLKTNNAY